MHNPLKIIFFIIIVFIISSCEKDNTFNMRKYNPPTAIYDFPDNKLWKHRVNTASDANEALKEFNGIELDVFFVENENEFQLGHDYPTGISLDSYFDSIPKCSKYYYWIDFKNLNSANAFKSVEEMKSIIAKYKLQDKIIVENSIPELLALYKLSGIFTSLWIPDISGNLFTSIAENNLYEDIESIVSNYQFDAISAHYNMVSFMEKYFRKYNCHIWTNGLTSENDKQQIINYASKSNIKIILVDYNINFLK